MIPAPDGKIDINVEAIEKYLRRKTMNNLIMTHFKMEEFTCKCGCGQNDMEYIFLNKLDVARGHAAIMVPDIRMVVNSGFRCLKHNRSIGSNDSSSHPRGYAGDIACTNSVWRFAMIDAFLAAGFTRIGVRKDFIHVDADPSKSPEVLWIY